MLKLNFFEFGFKSRLLHLLEDLFQLIDFTFHTLILLILAFSSCTSEIPVVMDEKYAKLVKTFLTNGSSVTLSQGASLSWRITNKKNVKNLLLDEKSHIGIIARIIIENNIPTIEVTSYDYLSGKFDVRIKLNIMGLNHNFLIG